MPLTASYCKKCGYSLAGLTSERAACPECGRDFNSADPTTYDTTPRHTRRRRLIKRLAATAFLIVLAILFLPRGYAVGRLTLGRAGRPITSVERIQLAAPAWFTNCFKAHYPAWNRRVSPSASAADLPSGVGFHLTASNHRLTLHGMEDTGTATVDGIQSDQYTLNGIPIDPRNSDLVFDTILPSMAADRPLVTRIGTVPSNMLK